MTNFIRPRTLDTVKQVLISSGIVECDDCYLTADVAPDGIGYSMSYRLTDAYKAPFGAWRSTTARWLIGSAPTGCGSQANRSTMP
jgi:hypothetical protein